MPALACFSSRMAIRTLEHRPGQLPAAARRTGPMSEQGNPYREEAAGIVSRLFAIAAQRLERAPDAVAETAIDVRQGLYIADLEEDVEEFTGEAATLRRIGDGFPAVRAGDRIVPIALPDSIATPGAPHLWRYRPWHPFDYEYLREFVQTWERTSPRDRAIMPVDAATETVRTGMTAFLATRIASVADFLGGARPQPNATPVKLSLLQRLWSTVRMSTVGFKVDVESTNPGLRIHVSPTFRRKWRYFGMPTNPVINTLTGGLYEFGADLGPSGLTTITADPTAFDIPYQTVSPRLGL